jgi:hypothetical protein
VKFPGPTRQNPLFPRRNIDGRFTSNNRHTVGEITGGAYAAERAASGPQHAPDGRRMDSIGTCEPKGTPRHAIDRLNAPVVEALADAVVQAPRRNRKRDQYGRKKRLSVTAITASVQA